MKQIKITREIKCYTEDEAKDCLNRFRAEAAEKGYKVGANGYTYKAKKSKGEVVAEGWLCKCTAIYNDFWGEDD